MHSCILTGYCDNQNARRLYDPLKDNIRISRDILFDEYGKSASFSELHTEQLESSSLSPWTTLSPPALRESEIIPAEDPISVTEKTVSCR